MRKIVLGLLASAAIVAASLAYAEPAAIEAAPNPAPVLPTTTASPATAVDCKAVLVTRPDVGEQKKFTVTFRNADLDAIKTCNAGGEVDQTPNGIRVVVQYGTAGAPIKLPSTMASGSVHTGRCINDAFGEVADGVMYKTTWEGGLPEKIALEKLDPAFYDRPAQLATCRRLNAEKKFH